MSTLDAIQIRLRAKQHRKIAFERAMATVRVQQKDLTHVAIPRDLKARLRRLVEKHRYKSARVTAAALLTVALDEFEELLRE